MCGLFHPIGIVAIMPAKGAQAMNNIDLLRYIVWFASQRSVKLTTVRVVKFVYLADLYHARAHGGKTLTAFPWAFVSYGPYCAEVMQTIDHAVSEGLISKSSRGSKFGEKDYNLFSCHDATVEKLEDAIPISVLSPGRYPKVWR